MSTFRSNKNNEIRLFLKEKRQLLVCANSVALCTAAGIHFAGATSTEMYISIKYSDIAPLSLVKYIEKEKRG